jgi:hypothetical protein
MFVIYCQSFVIYLMLIYHSRYQFLFVFLVVVSVVLGLACASPVFPRNPDVVAAETKAFLQHKAAADAAFVQEYNRLALLAAEAPDIHIYTDDRQHPEAQSVQYEAGNVVPDQFIYVPKDNEHNVQRVAVPDQMMYVPEDNEHNVERVTVLDQMMYVPEDDKHNVERVAVQDQMMYVPEDDIQDHVERMAGHQAGHMAGHQAQVVPTQGVTKWEGPFADTVPAGVNGLPRQVAETPEVMAARQALLDAHAAATKGEAEYNPSTADNAQVLHNVQEYTITTDNQQQAQHSQASVSFKQIHDFISQTKNEPKIVSHNQAGHLAGHFAGHIADQTISASSDDTRTAQEPINVIKKWEGPFADKVPAGVNGAPQQVTETPEVKEARHALYAAHAAVPKPDPLYN